MSIVWYLEALASGTSRVRGVFRESMENSSPNTVERDIQSAVYDN